MTPGLEPEAPIATHSRASRPLDAALAHLASGRRLRRTLPEIGFVYVERPLPFLCVHRRPFDDEDRGTAQLVTSFPSYFLVNAERSNRELAKQSIQSIAERLERLCGGVLVVEVSSAPAEVGLTDESPRFRLSARPSAGLDSSVAALKNALGQLSVGGARASVDVERCESPGPVAMPNLELDTRALGYIGLEVKPVYRSSEDQRPYPTILAQLRRGIDLAVRSAAFEFAHERVKNAPEHPHALGRRTLVKAARDADALLASVSDSLGYLLLVTPTNTDEAWEEFKQAQFERAPRFRYRPLHIDPELLKRKLYDTHLERIEDPTLTLIFREKQAELDRMINMLVDRETERFLWGSLQIFGGVDGGLESLARQIVEHTQDEPNQRDEGAVIDANGFAALAGDELAHYRESWPELDARIYVRDDVPNLMTLNGNLVMHRKMSLGTRRARALIQHEIGTHLVTYHNGRAQRLAHLSSGFAGYEALQEGLAVLAEYLAGGLSRTRLRIIAARVLAVKYLLSGASFVDTFRQLQREVGLDSPSAFSVSMRVYRSGGLTKDAIYLRGLGQALGYLSGGGKVEDLFVGKVAIHHLPLVHELRLRGVVSAPRLRPRYLDDPAAVVRLRRLSRGASVTDLLREE